MYWGKTVALGQYTFKLFFFFLWKTLISQWDMDLVLGSNLPYEPIEETGTSDSLLAYCHCGQVSRHGMDCQSARSAVCRGLNPAFLPDRLTGLLAC